jgi:hypothetical protein
MNIEAGEQNPESLTGAETLELFRARGLQPMAEFKPGQPLIYVLEDFYRGDDGPFGRLGRNNRPSFAYITNPVHLGPVRPGAFTGTGSTVGQRFGGRVIRDLLNQRSPVDLYAINRENGEMIFVRRERKSAEYQVVPENIFIADESRLPLPDHQA